MLSKIEMESEQNYNRLILKDILRRISGRRRFIQVLHGPRQTGKTTLARQLLDAFKGRKHYATADDLIQKDRSWIEQQWEIGRRLFNGTGGPGLLVLDEIQKIPGWSETAKRLWEEDTHARLPLHVLLLGSSPLLVGRGLSESLAGRFEVIPVTHWSYGEMRDAFGWNLDRYLFFGGYPGAATIVMEEQRWARYVIDSLIEPTLSRDILFMTRVDRPALLRRLFELASAYSGQILSYQKMLGQMQEYGNTITLAHYLRLLTGAGLVAGLSKYSVERVRQKGSSPKLLMLNTALMTALSGRRFGEAREDPVFWGRLVETAVGASLFAGVQGTDMEIFYWAAANCEVDYVLRRGRTVTAIEVKSGGQRSRLPGVEAFAKAHRVSRKLLVGGGGISLEEFLLMPTEKWVE